MSICKEAGKHRMVKELKMSRGLKRENERQGQRQEVGPRGTGEEAMSHNRLGIYVNLVLSKDLT